MGTFQVQLLLPLLVMVVLTFCVLFTLGCKRVIAVKKKTFDPAFYKLHRGATEPEHIHQVSRNLSNLFETPVLFYLAIVLTLVLQVELNALLYLAWLYAALRCLHSLVHCTSNVVQWRYRVFSMSLLVLLVYWAIVVVSVLPW